MEMEYKQNEIVWAKIIGYPWWPGAVLPCSYVRLVNVSSCRTVTSTKSSSWARTHSIVLSLCSCQLSGKKLAKFLPNQQFKLQANNDRRLRESIEVA
jgi:hypothetical protein